MNNKQARKQKKSILLLGATGSIGSQTIDIIRQFPEYFELIGIAGGQNIKGLKKIQEEFFLKDSQVFVGADLCVCPKKNKNEVTNKYQDINKSAPLQERLIQDFIKNNPADIYVNAISGMAGIPATGEIIKQQNPLCLANKESLVAHGESVMRDKQCTLIPIDSEHSSMANLMSKVSKEQVKKIWLTCSGGPFRDEKKFPKERFLQLSAQDALAHPTWDMGAKISIDSATLMNKAFELIEAVRLFGYPVEKFEVVIHPQSIVHAAVETIDGNITMEASEPSMHLPIARALFEAAKENFPDGDENFPSKNFPKFSPFGKKLSFEAVDNDRFPSLRFAQKALERGEETCRQLVTTNDESVELFLQGKISFSEIFERIEKIF